ncbi:Fructosamine kinase-domain-containing protein [Halenospora varia]|nr:Fructosamine kinase-domain-containing protein [Halenospora varia]
MPEGTKVVSAVSYGVSAWTKTGRISVILKDGTRKRYFAKYATRKGAQPLVEGEYHSGAAIDALVSGLVPKPTGWGMFKAGVSEIHFYLGDFIDLDLATAPEPTQFTSLIAELHQKGASPNGMFGFPVATVCGIMERTVEWETSWAKSFANQLKDVIKYDNETNGNWPEYDAACEQLLEVVIPRLLGVLQSEGRSITPTLIHGDLWEQNVGIDMETGDIILFDPGSVYAHNEMEFGTWRCSWAFHFNAPIYQRLYQRHIEPSEPAEEWDDRNRLYSLHPYLNDSAGHPGSVSRQTAYNDMLYLCEKYGPLDSLEKYDPEKDVMVTKAYVAHPTSQL